MQQLTTCGLVKSFLVEIFLEMDFTLHFSITLLSGHEQLASFVELNDFLSGFLALFWTAVFERLQLQSNKQGERTFTDHKVLQMVRP
ncbi:hypothetical protein Tco_0054145 [Tanacetum coccineum]